MNTNQAMSTTNSTYSLTDLKLQAQIEAAKVPVSSGKPVVVYLHEGTIKGSVSNDAVTIFEKVGEQWQEILA